MHKGDEKVMKMLKKKETINEEVIDEDNILLLFDEHTVVVNNTGWFIWNNIDNINGIDKLCEKFMRENKLSLEYKNDVFQDFSECIHTMIENGLLYE